MQFATDTTTWSEYLYEFYELDKILHARVF